jgi:hypothetical protein
MQETRNPRDDREDLWRETLWSLGLVGAVVVLIVLISTLAQG